MKRAMFTLAAVILAGMAVSQDLPPGVLLLSHVKSHIKEDLQRLPDISCLETVQREHQVPKGKMRPLDTIRLVDTENSVRIENAGFRSVREINPVSKFSRV